MLEPKRAFKTKIERFPLIFMFWCSSNEWEKHCWCTLQLIKSPSCPKQTNKEWKKDWSRFNFPTNFHFSFCCHIIVKSIHTESAKFGRFSETRKHLLPDRWTDGCPDDTFSCQPSPTCISRQTNTHFLEHILTWTNTCPKR